jgi:hypothetical protein
MNTVNLDRLKFAIANKRRFTLGQRGIAVSFRFEERNNAWKVSIFRAQVYLLVDRLGFDEPEEHLILRNAGFIDLNEYNVVKMEEEE